MWIRSTFVWAPRNDDTTKDKPFPATCRASACEKSVELISLKLCSFDHVSAIFVTGVGAVHGKVHTLQHTLNLFMRTNTSVHHHHFHNRCAWKSRPTKSCVGLFDAAACSFCRRRNCIRTN